MCKWRIKKNLLDKAEELGTRERTSGDQGKPAVDH